MISSLPAVGLKICPVRRVQPRWWPGSRPIRRRAISAAGSVLWSVSRIVQRPAWTSVRAQLTCVSGPRALAPGGVEASVDLAVVVWSFSAAQGASSAGSTQETTFGPLASNLPRRAVFSSGSFHHPAGFGRSRPPPSPTTVASQRRGEQPCGGGLARQHQHDQATPAGPPKAATPDSTLGPTGRAAEP